MTSCLWNSGIEAGTTIVHTDRILHVLSLTRDYERGVNVARIHVTFTGDCKDIEYTIDIADDGNGIRTYDHKQEK